MATTARLGFISLHADTSTPHGAAPTPLPNCAAGYTNGIGTVGGFELWRNGVMVGRITPKTNLTPGNEGGFGHLAATAPVDHFFINDHNSGSGCGTGQGDGILMWSVPVGTTTLWAVDAAFTTIDWDLIQFNFGSTIGQPLTLTIYDVNGSPMSAVSTGGIWSRSSWGVSVDAPQFVQLFVPSDYVFGAFTASIVESSPISDYFEFLSPLPPPPPPVLENASAPGGGFGFGRRKRVSYTPLPALPITNVVEVDTNVS